MSLQLKHHDEVRFRELLDQFFLRLKRFAGSFLKEDVLAEEVVMDVFLKLWERRETLDQIENLNTYLFVAVRNLCYNVLRREHHLQTDSLEDVEVELTRYANTPEDDLISEQMLETLNSAVEELPAKCKMVFKLLREEGLSRKETAQVLGISANTVDNQIAIAVRKIGETLGMDLTIKKNYSGLQSFLLCL